MTARLVTLGLSSVLFLGAPAFAQQVGNQPAISPNPVIEQLLRAVPDDTSIVELKGFVGPSTPDTVRLYTDFSLTRYLDIPRNAIVSSLQEGDAKSSPLKVYVRASAVIVSARRQSARAASHPHVGHGAVVRGFVSGHMECQVSDMWGLECQYVTDLPR